MESHQGCALFMVSFSLSAFYMVDCTIGCFKCVSLNGNNPACDDPFHNNYTVDIYQSTCMGGRKNRNGLFPATACIKMSGYYVGNGTRLTVRDCALDSGTATTDTEIIRMSHCGLFQFDGKQINGCLQSCNDADGCNAASVVRLRHYPLLLVAACQFLFNALYPS